MPAGTPTVSTAAMLAFSDDALRGKQNDIFGDRADKQCCENLNKSHVQSQAITPTYNLPQVYKQSGGYLMALNLSLDRPNHNNSQSRSVRFLSYEQSVLSSCPRYDLCATPFSRALMTTWYVCMYFVCLKGGKCAMHLAPQAPRVGLQCGSLLGQCARWTRIRDLPVLRH